MNKFILYHVLLETRNEHYKAEVGADGFDNAIELFKIHLFVEKGIEEWEIINTNGDHIGTHHCEEIVEVY